MAVMSFAHFTPNPCILDITENNFPVPPANTNEMTLIRSKLLTLSSCHPFDTDPPEREHGAMVVDVQEGNLTEFLPQDEKHCVQVLDAFRDEIPPQSSCHLSQTGHEKWVEGRQQAQAEERNQEHRQLEKKRSRSLRLES